MTGLGSDAVGAPSPTLADRLIALAPLAPDDFFRITLEGAASVLRDAANPLRLNLFSTAIRMLFEHVMGTLAPDADVEACPWYTPVEGQDRPVRAQRIRYWLQGGLEDGWVKDELRLEAEPLRGRLLKAFNKLSKHVHGRVQTLVRDAQEQETEAAATVGAVEELLHAFHDCRITLIEPLIEELDEAAIDDLLSETIQSIDELATHHTIEEIYTAHTDVALIGPDFVRYRASGSVSVTLQWGSNSDMRRGDGAELDESFPFECLFDVPLDDPRDLGRAEVVSGVDTSSWYGDDWRDEGAEEVGADDGEIGKLGAIDVDSWLAAQGDDRDRPDF